jgi:prepilin-type N-terminal cleavage/methylation domain-containing protein
MRSRIKGRLLCPRDDGFTLIESIVALSLAVIIFMALTFALIGGVHQVLLSQQNQQAGDILNQAVEKARAITYDNLLMQTSDLDVGETGRAPALSVGKYNPSNDSTSGAGLEPLAVATVGGLVPHVTTVTQNGGTYTVKRYVTLPTDATGAVYKRLTVVVSWTSLGKTHNRSYSTFVSPTKRGLPLPNYKFTNVGGLSECRNPSSQAVFEFTVTNNGARDQWLLSTSPTPPAWTFYEDTNGDQLFDPVNDQQLSTFNGSPTTGLLDTNTKKVFFAVADVPSAGAAAPPYTWNTTFTATSASISTYTQSLTGVTSVTSSACGAPTASPTPTPTTTTTTSPTPTPTPTSTATTPSQPAAPCAAINTASATTPSGATLVRYYVYNPSQPGNTVASQDMPVLRDTGTPPAAGSLYDYSTDLLASTAGRELQYSATGATTSPYLASWLYQMPSASSVKKGSAELTLFAAPANGSATAQPNFSVSLTNGATTLGTGTFSTPAGGWGCSGGYRAFTVTMALPNNSNTIATNGLLRVNVTLTNNVPVLLAYGTATFPSEFSVPYTGGNG